MTAYTKLVEADAKLEGLAAYHGAAAAFRRPRRVHRLLPRQRDGAAGDQPPAPSSRKALEAALQMARVFPHIDFRREVTIGHLRPAVLAKVNPPIRPREDVEFLWEQLLEGKVDWVVSDHACCRHETKAAKHALGNIWLAKSGFGGTEYLLAALVSEGTRRGLSLNAIARLTSFNPAKRFGLNAKGDIASGLDADLALLDPRHTWTIRAGFGVDPGLHAVRGHRAPRKSEGHFPARRAHLRNGSATAARQVPASSDMNVRDGFVGSIGNTARSSACADLPRRPVATCLARPSFSTPAAR